MSPPSEAERADSSTTPPAADGSGLVDLVLRWAGPAMLALGLVLTARRTLAPISDPDTFWHVRAGRYLWSTWAFTGPDPLGTFSTRDWTLHEWLPQLVIAGADHLGGLTALAWLQLAADWSILLCVYLCARWVGARPLVAGALATIAWIGTFGGFALRPQIITFDLVAIVTAAWLRTRADGRPRWWLVPLSWVWACSHGMWFLGIGIGLTAVVGLALDRRIDRRQGLALAAIPGLQVLVTALTPIGPRLLTVPFTIGGYTDFVDEWATPSIRDPRVIAALIPGVLVVLGWARRRARASWFEIGLLAFGVGWTLLYNRTIAIGAVMLAVLAAAAVQSWLPARAALTRRAEAATIALGIVLGVLAAALGHPPLHRQQLVAAEVDAAVSQLPAGTVVYNDYGLGGWLFYAHPTLRPVIDGRTEVYDAGYVKAHLDSLGGKPGWSVALDRSGATAAVLPTDSPLLAELTAERGWTILARGGGEALLRAPGR